MTKLDINQLNSSMDENSLEKIGELHAEMKRFDLRLDGTLPQAYPAQQAVNKINALLVNIGAREIHVSKAPSGIRFTAARLGQ